MASDGLSHLPIVPVLRIVEGGRTQETGEWGDSYASKSSLSAPLNNPTRTVKTAEKTMIDTMPAKSPENPFSGNLAQSCGVSAMIDQREGTGYKFTMQATIQDLPMDLPAPSKWLERALYVKDSIGLLAAAQRKHGGIVEARSAAKMLKVSRARLYQLLDNGFVQRAEVRDADGEILIEGFSASSLLEWAKTVKDGGSNKARK